MSYTKIFSGNLFHFIYHSVDITANYYTILLLKNFKISFYFGEKSCLKYYSITLNKSILSITYVCMKFSVQLFLYMEIIWIMLWNLKPMTFQVILKALFLIIMPPHYNFVADIFLHMFLSPCAMLNY